MPLPFPDGRYWVASGSSFEPHPKADLMDEYIDYAKRVVSLQEVANLGLVTEEPEPAPIRLDDSLPTAGAIPFAAIEAPAERPMPPRDGQIWIARLDSMTPVSVVAGSLLDGDTHPISIPLKDARRGFAEATDERSKVGYAAEVLRHLKVSR